MKERRQMLAAIHLPTNHRLLIFEVSYVSVPKRETPSSVHIQDVPVVSKQYKIHRQSLFQFFGEKTFTFSYRKDQNHVTFFLPSRKDHSDLGNDFFSLNKFKVLISGYTEIRCTRIMRLTRITIVTRNSRFAVLTKMTPDSPEPQKQPAPSEQSNSPVL